MIDATDTTLRASIKALRDVVAPALDPDATQAAEQLRLVVDALDFLRQRVGLVEERELFLLEHDLALARAVTSPAAACAPACADALAAAIARAEDVLARAAVRRAEVVEAGAALGAALRELIRDAATADPAARDAIERATVRAARATIAADRAWYLPQGFDPDPGAVPPIEAALAVRE
ncbi:MAG: hypothetical protein JWO74_3905 [Solirubrobacterales bacterium]|nr:hypothetical protein [Solirubrobacterales bacterium]